MIDKAHALELLKKMYGGDTDFRPGQWEAIEAITVKRQRALVVQRTGWGKSAIYFLATKLLRETGAGPTLLISPLLSLIRNQIENARKIGLCAQTINSSNNKEWKEINEIIRNNECDLLLISPERLNNDHFLKQVLPQFSSSIGMFVVDEAHCISDWGHDFRPEYRRIVRILQTLPKGVPILGTTATANQRVVEDIQTQLGPGLLIHRGPLDRESLRLQNIQLSNKSERLAWLAGNLPKFKRSGIIYCLTVADTKVVAGWLKQKGFFAEAYHAGDDENINRAEMEDKFLNNKVKILVATVALGMGFDKPDIEFVIHFQRPASVVAYYQQVGRAGRALDKSYGILLSGEEDDDINQYFIESAFPSLQVFLDIIKTLETSEEMPLYKLLAKVNTSAANAEKALKILEVDQAVGKRFYGGVKYFRTPNSWKPDVARINRVLDMRTAEKVQMQDYMVYKGCLMKFLLEALDDPEAAKCGRCANCHGKGFSPSVSKELVLEAENYLKTIPILIQPRKKFPEGLLPDSKLFIPREHQNALGRSLCNYGNAEWGKLVKIGKYQESYFNDALVIASTQLIKDSWKPSPFPTWVTAIPSMRHPTLVRDFAARLAFSLGIPFRPILIRTGDAHEQKTMNNNSMQAQNVMDTLGLKQTPSSGPVLLVDDIIDSGWTLTVAGYILQKHGSGFVYPFTLARATGKK